MESALLQESSKLRKIAEGIRIIHSTGNHWVTVSTINTSEGEVNVYDSLYSSVCDGTLNIIRNRFQDYSKVNVIVPQKQTNLCDCGLFAIANATALAFGIDPTATKLDIGNMRSHLTKCFEENFMTLFPQK